MQGWRRQRQLVKSNLKYIFFMSFIYCSSYVIWIYVFLIIFCRRLRMLMWEDGFCRGRVSDCLEQIEGEDPVRKAFSKMSIQLYNYGEGWVLGRCFF